MGDNTNGVEWNIHEKEPEVGKPACFGNGPSNMPTPSIATAAAAEATTAPDLPTTATDITTVAQLTVAPDLPHTITGTATSVQLMICPPCQGLLQPLLGLPHCLLTRLMFLMKTSSLMGLPCKSC
jgi:hypothetical protein